MCVCVCVCVSSLVSSVGKTGEHDLHEFFGLLFSGDACVSRASLSCPCLVSCTLVSAHGTDHMCNTLQSVLSDCVKYTVRDTQKHISHLFKRIDSSNFLTEKLINAHL